ncbi:MAG: amidohydrolase [Marinilabilia sp.]
MDIALIQTELQWEDIHGNLSCFETLLTPLSRQFDLIVLPEMFSTGFTMAPEQFSREELNSIPLWMKTMARTTGSALAGSSVAVNENGYYNRFYFTTPEGAIAHYDKRHLFRMGEEQDHYLPGEERKVFSYNEWRICPMVCYDLRFPVWSRNQEDYDVLIFVANWPAVRRDAWDALLKARAIENQSYVVGVNRTGSDPRVNYNGGSVVYSPKGEVISQPSASYSYLITARIDRASLQSFREKFPAWMDRDGFAFS